MSRVLASAGALAVMCVSPVAAQEGETPTTIKAVMTAVPDPASVEMPRLAAAGVAGDAADFDKYYVFHRDGTDFPTALADLRECDGLARGLASSVGYQSTYIPYGGLVGNALGGAIGNAVAAAIFGSAQKRAMRRVNMRRCMHYKGYGRFGLPKDLWQPFNFEEGLGSVKEADRQRMLAQQAKVASAPAPLPGRELGL